jgi:hypothetical protein
MRAADLVVGRVKEQSLSGSIFPFRYASLRRTVLVSFVLENIPWLTVQRFTDRIQG